MKKLTGGSASEVAAAQTSARTIVQNMNKEAGLAQLPKLNADALISLGFDKNSFAQMDADNLTEEDARIIALLGLAEEDFS